MPSLLRMPSVSADASEAVLSEWLVEQGAALRVGDAIATVETAKALVEIECEEPGVLVVTLAAAGAEIEVGDPIALIAAGGEVVADVDAALAELGVGGPGGPDARASQPSPAVSREPAQEPPAPTQRRIFSSPLARKLAKEAGLTLPEIPGTGPRGRVLRRDVEAAVAAREDIPVPAEPASTIATSGSAGSPAGASSSAAEPATEVTVTRIPHSPMRRSTAQRLAASKQEAPHFYLRATVRVERLLALRAEIKESSGLPISINDLLVKAVAAAHAAVPRLNCTWGPDDVEQHQVADIAVAVATERGLLTPVVRDVGSLTVGRLAGEIRDLADRARSGRLRQHELEGGTITVTNLGMFGVEEFAAIINPPHAAILAVGAVRDEPVVESGAVVPGKVVSLTLSVDHRPVDGVIAAQWLAALVAALERPIGLLA